MRLWIDGQCLQSPSRTRGIGRYVLELIRAIAMNHSDVELAISFNAELGEEAVTARRLVENWVCPAHIHVWEGAARSGEALLESNPGRRISELALLHHIRCLAPDVTLCASPFEGLLDCTIPFLPDEGFEIPSAAVFYDAIPARFEDKYLPSALSRDAYYRRLARCGRFDLLLCISDFVKGEADELIPDIRSINIGAGLSRSFEDQLDHASNRRSILPAHDFVLYVGGLDWRKNINLIPQAFTLLPPLMRDSLKFVVAGDHRAADVAKVRTDWESRGLKPENLLYRNHPSDAELVELYRGAKALLLPSFMEGFGLTALEAMACGTPVAVARTGAMRELVGDEDLMFDPTSPTQLASCLVNICTSTEFSERARERNLTIARHYNWEKTASLAINALSGLRAAKPVNFDLRAIRKKSAEQCRGERLNLHQAANVLARSEPTTTPSPRLLIDATATMRVDYKTGIQRVVNNICGLINDPENDDAHETVISYCDDDTGWYGVHEGVQGTPVKCDENRITPAPSDRILMLDSSWDLHRTHRQFLACAQARGCKIISCLYDTVPMQVPAFCDPAMPTIFSQWFQNALQISTGFVCISRAVADELHDYLTALRFPRPMNIGYWHLGADFSKLLAPPYEKEIENRDSSPTFLMVGTLEPRKGHTIALDAFEKLWNAGVDARLIVVGGRGWGTDHVVDRMIAHPEYGKRLLWHNTVDDQKLALLYRNSDALIAASYAEGFGLPIVEAHRCGLPAIVSDIPVFREIATNTHMVDFFTAGSAQSLCQEVTTFLKRCDTGHTVSPDCVASDTLSWADSAMQLRDIVVGDKWNRVYLPSEPQRFASSNDIGTIRMNEVIRPEERACRLELVEGPYRNGDDTALKIVVSLTNLSSLPWTSDGHDGGKYGVFLGISRTSRTNRFEQDLSITTGIPFIMVPGQRYYLSLEVPKSCKCTDTDWVEIDVLQKGVGWFGTPLRVNL